MMSERCSPASRLYIAVPAYTGDVRVETAQALVGAYAALTAVGVDVRVGFNLGCPYLDHARNILVTAFLKSDATDLLFVDADVGFDPVAAVRIAQATRPFIAGIYPKKSDEPAWPVQFDVDELYGDEDGLVEAVSVPTGFLRLNRAVFDHLPHDDYTDSGEAYRGFFSSGIRAGRYVGEDNQLCDDWRAVGGRVFIIPDLAFTHTGPKSWAGSWAGFMQSRMEMEKAA